MTLRRPHWMSLPVVSHAVPMVVTTAEEKAYCRAHGIRWYARMKCEIRASAPHPRSAYRELPSVQGKTWNLAGQLTIPEVEG